VIGPSEGVRLRLPLTGAVVTYSLSLVPRPKRTVFGGRDPVVLRGGMGTKAVALSRLKPQPVGACRSLHQGWVSASPALDTLLEAAPIAFKGRLVQCILRLHPGKTTADPRQPRPANWRPRRVAGQACPRVHQPRLPRPRRLVAETSTCRQEGQDT